MTIKIQFFVTKDLISGIKKFYNPLPKMLCKSDAEGSKIKILKGVGIQTNNND